MKISEIEAIVKMMSENDLTEFKIESEGLNLSLKRGASVSPAAVQPLPQPLTVPAAVPQPAAVQPVIPAVPVAESVKGTPVTIDSPIVGTFYRSSTPDTEPFVKIGSRVTPDTTVCIIEAMKVMNDIKAEKSGIIKEILAENGQSVEYGQPLFVIE